jgi:hypothetical protein
MWVMLIKKIACVVSPPKMSIHWAEPWPMARQHRQAKEKLKAARKCLDSSQEFCSEEDICGFSNQPIIHDVRRASGAMGIIFMGEHIRIFPEEFTAVPDDCLEEYIDIKDGSHILIEYQAETGANTPSQWTNKDQKLLYEAALLDGCTPLQAMSVMAGRDVSTVPVMGWYRAKPEYGRYFCKDEELEITDCRSDENHLQEAAE